MIQPGDIILTTSDSFVSRGIRFFTRMWGEEKTKYSHAALAMNQYMVYEAVYEGIKKSPVSRFDGKPMAIFRPMAGQKLREQAMFKAHKAHVSGMKYPKWRLAAHLFDWLLGLGIWDVYLFRRFMRSENTMECAYFVAHCYSPGLFYRPEYISPDDLDDLMRDNQWFFELVWEGVWRS